MFPTEVSHLEAFRILPLSGSLGEASFHRRWASKQLGPSDTSRMVKINALGLKLDKMFPWQNLSLNGSRRNFLAAKGTSTSTSKHQSRLLSSIQCFPSCVEPELSRNPLENWIILSMAFQPLAKLCAHGMGEGPFIRILQKDCSPKKKDL
jgi:hypothetical protein